MATAYVVLGEHENAFGVIGETEASNDQQAIAKVLTYNGAANSEGVYVAVPKRSWKLRTVAPRQAFTFS